MSTSSRTTQLAAWREIITKRHDVTQPVSKHLDFIRKRFEGLDSAGFIWNRESVFSVFLQLGLSRAPRDAFSRIDEIFESRALQGVEISSDDVQEVIHSEESRHRSRPLGLMDLPVEVFDKILGVLDDMARLEKEDVAKQKHMGKVVISGPGERKPYMTYLHRNAPVLNSIQTFALLCREIYQLCRPWLWRKLRFPTSLPAPIDLWTEDILLRQGTYVRSLEFGLSDNCSKPPNEFAVHDPFYDNLTPELKQPYHIEWISPKNVVRLIERCPNLSTLNIEYEYLEKDADAGGTETFLLQLVPLLSSLKQLRQLTLIDGYNMTIMNEFPSKVVGSLPLLESLTCWGLTASGAQQKAGEGSFGFNLSQLEHLSQLDLCRIEDMDENWCLYDWPRKITHLGIQDCGDLLPTSAYRIIHHIAPYLTKLALTFAYKEGDDSWEIDPSWKPQTRFSLPFLTDLELSSRNANLLDSFRDCQSLGVLDWTYRTLKHCWSLNQIIFKATWPQLTKLHVVPYMFLRMSALEPESQAMEDQLVSLEKYCEEANMNAIVRRPYMPPRS